MRILMQRFLSTTVPSWTQELSAITANGMKQPGGSKNWFLLVRAQTSCHAEAMRFLVLVPDACKRASPYFQRSQQKRRRFWEDARIST